MGLQEAVISERHWSSRSTKIIAAVAEDVAEVPGLSTSWRATELGIHLRNWQIILVKDVFYKVQTVLLAVDYQARVKYAQANPNHDHEYDNFWSNIILGDLSVYVNRENYRFCSAKSLLLQSVKFSMEASSGLGSRL